MTRSWRPLTPSIGNGLPPRRAREEASLAQGRRLTLLLEENSRLTAHVQQLTADVHRHLLGERPHSHPDGA